MSVQSINTALEKLINVHQTLLNLSQEKTVVLKNGNLDQLQTLLVQERKQIQVLQKMETNRVEAVNNWFQNNDAMTEEQTISNLLEKIKDVSEKEKLTNLTVALTQVMLELKQQEQLNQALVQQSVQFVQLSLDMLSPTLKNMNYGNNQSAGTTNRSVFDSKA
ncbi:flagellar protein FlgN [Virgibacillus sp. MG-45]|uniref:flagellar protein FlgN n=1 Tax=Virgibacillus sp. MG-45 TaxID=3102791 RepID=UPI002ED7FA5F